MNAITRFAGLLETLGTECLISSWRVLVTRPVEATQKKNLPGWSPARFKGARRGAQVIDVGAVVLDHDDGLLLDAILERWADHYTIVHTTFTSTAECPKHRVIVPTSRRFSADEHSKLWRWAQRIDPTVDGQTKDCGRFWFAPAARTGARYVWRETSGALLDVDQAIASLPPEAPRQVAVPFYRGWVGQSELIERARRYLARVPGAVSGAGGHQTTWQVALVLVKGFSLAAHDALELMLEWNQGCSPPWSERELVHKLASAAQARDVVDGYLLNGQRRTA